MKTNRIVILTLAFSLALGSLILFYQRSFSVISIHIETFNLHNRGGCGGECSNQTAPVNKININEADVETLAKLPGIGDATAARIVEHRIRKGRFSAIEDIKNVKGIKEGLYEKIKDDIRVD